MTPREQQAGELEAELDRLAGELAQVPAGQRGELVELVGERIAARLVAGGADYDRAVKYGARVAVALEDRAALAEAPAAGSA